MFSDFLLRPYLYSSSLHWRVETLACQNQDLIVCRSISNELSASSTHEFAIVYISSQTLVSVASPPHPTATWPKLSISRPCQLLSFRGCTVDDSVCSPIPAASPHLTATSGDPVISRDIFQLLLNLTSSRSFECRLEYYKWSFSIGLFSSQSSISFVMFCLFSYFSLPSSYVIAHRDFSF